MKGSCMAVISIGGYRFTIAPETASWSYAMNIKPFETYGGRVVQLLACSVNKLSVEGYISPKGNVKSQSDPLGQWQGMREFEYNVKQIMAVHEVYKQSVLFDFPEVGWNGNVWLTGYSDVRYEPSIPAVRYTLSFDIDSGFDSITEAISDYGLKNIPDGVGWVRNVYNTPLPKDWETYKEAIAAVLDDIGTFDASNPLDFYKYLEEAYAGKKDDSSAKDVLSSAVSAAAEGAASAFSAVATNALSSGFMESMGIAVRSVNYLS